MAYKQYTAEFKREVLEMAASGERSIAQLERDLGITPGLICKWRQRYRVDASGKGVLPPGGAEHPAEALLRRLGFEASSENR